MPIFIGLLPIFLSTVFLKSHFYALSVIISILIIIPLLIILSSLVNSCLGIDLLWGVGNATYTLLPVGYKGFRGIDFSK